MSILIAAMNLLYNQVAFLRKKVMNHQAGNCTKQTWIRVYPILQPKC